MVEHKIEVVIEEAMRIEVEGDYSMVMVPKEGG